MYKHTAGRPVSIEIQRGAIASSLEKAEHRRAAWCHAETRQGTWAAWCWAGQSKAHERARAAWYLRQRRSGVMLRQSNAHERARTVTRQLRNMRESKNGVKDAETKHMRKQYWDKARHMRIWAAWCSCCVAMCFKTAQYKPDQILISACVASFSA